MSRLERLVESRSLHVLLLVAVAIWVEALFWREGINFLDEGWPLYAAMQVKAGGTLYQDILFVFPPGHLLAAWLGQTFDPPGVLFARVVYSCFNVAVVPAIYWLGLRVMPAPYAAFGALLVAVSTPGSHTYHFLFGYRYLVWSALALLCFARRLDTGRVAWMGAAGVLLGISMCFRISPALAGLGALGLAVLTADRRPTRWIADGVALVGGFLVIVVPVASWFAASAGFEALWLEIVERPIIMTELQSFEVQPVFWPDFSDRESLFRTNLALEFRVFSLLYFGYGLALAIALFQFVFPVGGRRGAPDVPFPHAFLLAIVLWGGVYFTRAFGRSDQAHLDSALPPVCLLMAHLAYLALTKLPEVWRRTRLPAPVVVAICLLVSGAWLYGRLVDGQFQRGMRQGTALRSIDERIGTESVKAKEFDSRVLRIRQETKPGDTILDLSASPLFHVFTERMGPGGLDLVMPGTFLDEDEERAFIRRLEANPPALVIRSEIPFDRAAHRSVAASAPLLGRWVYDHYVDGDVRGWYRLMYPRTRPRPIRREVRRDEATPGS